MRIWLQSFEEEDSHLIWCLPDRPFCAEDIALPSRHKLSRQDYLPAMAGAVFIHLLFLITQLLAHHFCPQPPAPPAFVTVSLVSIAEPDEELEIGDGSGGGAGASMSGVPACGPLSAPTEEASPQTPASFFPAPAPAEAEDKIMEDDKVLEDKSEPTPVPAEPRSIQPAPLTAPPEKIPKPSVPPKKPKQDRPEPSPRKPSSAASSKSPKSSAAAPAVRAPAEHSLSSTEGSEAEYRAASASEQKDSGPGKGGTGSDSGRGPGTGSDDGPGAGGDRAGAFQLGAVDEPPKIISKVEPDYPPDARRRSMSGKVVIRFLVDSHGRVVDPSIVEAKPQGIFEKCVLEALRKWRFKPGIYKGKPVSTWMVLPIHFQMTG